MFEHQKFNANKVFIYIISIYYSEFFNLPKHHYNILYKGKNLMQQFTVNENLFLIEHSQDTQLAAALEAIHSHS